MSIEPTWRQLSIGKVSEFNSRDFRFACRLPSGEKLEVDRHPAGVRATVSGRPGPWSPNSRQVLRDSVASAA